MLKNRSVQSSNSKHHKSISSSISNDFEVFKTTVDQLYQTNQSFFKHRKKMNKSSFVFPSIAKLEEEIKREESKIIKDNDASPYIDREDYDFQKCKSTYTFKMKAKNVIKNRNL